MNARAFGLRVRDVWNESRCWCLGILVAVSLHVAVVGALLYQRTPAATAPVATAFTVDLAMLPSAPAVKPSELPPGPTKVEALKSHAAPKVPLKAVPIEPPPLRADAPADAVTVAKEETPRPEERLAQDHTELQTTAPKALAAPPADKMKAPVQGASGQVPVDAKQTWEALLLAHLEKLKRYPYMAQRAGQQDTVYVKFVLDRRGQVLSCAIQSSRGFPILDREALELIERASPLPPPPDEIKGERLTQIVPIEYFVTRLN